MRNSKGQFVKGFKRSEEEIRKMVLKNTGKKRSEETKRKISMANKGKIFSKEHRQKLSEVAKKRKFSEETRKKISVANKGRAGYWLGKKLSKEHRQKLSFLLLGNKHSLGRKYSEDQRRQRSEKMKGEKGNNWQGGINPINDTIRKSLDTKIWRDSVFIRDNYTCQKYGTNGGDLEAHHIQNFAQHPELRFAIDNGITLNDKAHREFHKKYGMIDNTREQLEEFLKN